MIRFPAKVNSRESRIAWLVENKQLVLAQKKAAMKICDAICAPVSVLHADRASKEIAPTEVSAKRIRVRAVVNTTRYFDSHHDVHIDQLWNKSIRETKINYLVREHRLDFDNIISDDVHVFVKQIPWRELGYDAPGTTQALIYDAIIDRDNSPVMFDKYLAGKVRNHSVQMRYVKVQLAVNNPDYEEYKVWEKYAPDIVNIEDAEEVGYFFAVTEAKNIEGSAVVIGSNPVTPTLFVEHKSEPSTHSVQEPAMLTPELLVKMYNPLKFLK